jgi:proline iminopeptidase
LETAKKNLLRVGTADQIKVCEKLWSGCFTSREDLIPFFQLTNTLYSVKARTSSQEVNFAKKSLRFSYDVLNEGFRQGFWNFDYELELQKLHCPTLILAGRQDWINDVSHAEFMVARIPHSQSRIFENASHAMEADVGEEYYKTIAEFIQA